MERGRVRVNVVLWRVRRDASPRYILRLAQKKKKEKERKSVSVEERTSRVQTSDLSRQNNESGDMSTRREALTMVKPVTWSESVSCNYRSDVENRHRSRAHTHRSCEQAFSFDSMTNLTK